MTSLHRNNTSIIDAPAANGNQLFPVFLKLNELHTVIVGAGNIGHEKLNAVLQNSPLARITVVATQVSSAVKQLAALYPDVTIKQKSFEENDFYGADLVIAATGNAELNQYLRGLAKERKLLINVADKPELCDFYLSSIVQKGDLKIAISTNGKSPTIAKRLKEILNNGLPDELNTTLQQVNQLRNSLNGDFGAKVKELNRVTALLIKPAAPKKSLRWLIWVTLVISIVITISALWFKEPMFRAYVEGIDPLFYYFLAAGFAFAMIDGAIGMSYGVTSTTFSLSMGIPPASASMGVHLSEIMSNGIAGWMHYRLGNVNWRLFKLLLIPGAVGAVLGAYLLSSLEHYSSYTKPAVSVYTLILGYVILKKAFDLKKKRSADKIKKVSLLGFGGGFIDAVGGGGWGSIVLSSLIAGGRHPRFSLGTVKLSRFFIALLSSLTFITMLNSGHWQAVAGLVIGSALAAPIATRISNRISSKTIMVAVGVIVMLTSLKSIVSIVLKLI